ncbi:hypothetical protein [Nostoc sp.]
MSAEFRVNALIQHSVRAKRPATANSIRNLNYWLDRQETVIWKALRTS